MKNLSFTSRRRRAGFTLVELLVVIAIIAILAAMTLAVVNKVAVAGKKTKARTEAIDLANAINAYDAQYGRFPIMSYEQSAVGTNDFTTGLVASPQFGATWNSTSKGYSYNNNSNIVAILMDLEQFPNGNPTANYKHVKNPKQTKFLNAKLSGDTGTSEKPLGGVDNNGIYRDPWGNPYIITVDANYDDQAGDLFYCQQNVSQNGNNSTAGYNGLFNPNSANPNADNFLFRGKAMVWSAGPDGKFDSSKAATIDVNKDNVLSWQ